MKAYLYIRFSTLKQEQGDSVRRQIKAAEKWCRYNNATLSDLTFEDLGVSAFKEGGSRPALADLLDALKTGKIERGSYVLFENTDRLTRRGYKHALDLVTEIVNLDVSLVMVATGAMFTRQTLDNLAPILPLLLDADRARAESERKSQLIKAAKGKVRDQELLRGKMPFWINLIDGVAELNERTEVAIKIIDLKLKGWSNNRIAKALNESNIPSANYKQWNASAIRITIANHALYGAKQYNVTVGKSLKEVKVVGDKFPALMSKSAWLSIQRDPKNAKKGRTSVQSPFSCLFKCGVCGSGMVQRTTVYKGERRLYRKCSRAVDGACSHSTLIREPDSVVLECLKHLKYKPVTRKTNDLTVEVKSAENQLSELKEAVKLVSNAQALAMMYVDIAEKEQALSELRAKVDKELLVPDEADFKLIMSLPTVVEQQTELRKVIDRIVLKNVKKKTWRVTVYMANKHRQTFNVFYSHYDWKIGFKSDTEKTKSLVNTLLEGIE